MAYRFTRKAAHTTRAYRNASTLFFALLALFAFLGLVKTVHAFQPNPVLEHLPDNTAKHLGAYTCTDVPGEWAGKCRLVHDFSGMQYDANRHQMVIFGGGPRPSRKG